MASSQQAVPRFYFSLRSPYSWLAYRRLTEHHPDVAASVEWRPFFEPDADSAALLREAGGHFPYTDMSRDKHLYILQDVRRCARDAGLTPVWPVDRDPVWEVPHLAYLAAVDEGRGPDLLRRLYELRWEEGRDICDRAVVAEAAAGLGLPAGRLAAASDDSGLRARGIAALRAVDRDGVFGVPFFVHGRDKFWGLDRLGAFVASVLGARPHDPAPPPELVLGADGDQGHAGGCG
ncbi:MULTISPECIES: DsbA family protein [unclassified Streptomyces]|uniref:2-hydroxychromene-2-carboxylate isomerase n=1 Tax=unclassified Streptomyces TaxID=2593676 RepID=UPI002DD9DAF1|nr:MULTISPECIES: DsbA family protein [unclassified Streptomyces]WSA90496.1 DsbA family protein [Streptomyces sp. NBC_01795]WSB74821.1 DsbA family protein [Streptomyces sp. NBC_01775]WSS16896.1 DsbA family protein [Streptomyces sp. NBC_01186]WSS45639.1 DsbA family protein [Streptomyces sp. NBC_01187]